MAQWGGGILIPVRTPVEFLWSLSACANSSGFNVEADASLSSATWNLVTNLANLSKETAILLLPIGATNQLFRRDKP